MFLNILTAKNQNNKTHNVVKKFKKCPFTQLIILKRSHHSKIKTQNLKYNLKNNLKYNLKNLKNLKPYLKNNLKYNLKNLNKKMKNQ